MDAVNAFFIAWVNGAGSTAIGTPVPFRPTADLEVGRPLEAVEDQIPSRPVLRFHPNQCHGCEG